MTNSVPYPSYHYQGEIAVSADRGFHQGYLDFPFEVPPGVGALRLRLRIAPRQVRGVANLVTLGLFDPQGFRGNAHRNPPDRDVYLSARGATPGFVTGPIQTGAWLAQLALHAVLADETPCTYSLHIELLPDILEIGLFDQAHPAPAGSGAATGRPGWYRGEMHTHTVHSDGRVTPDELVDLARRRQLNFLAITDHNTTSALAEVDPVRLEGLALIPGVELTTFAGHALVLGAENWIDWRTGYRGWTMEDAARAAHAAGGLFILAHPGDVPSPVCTGCRWDYPDFDLSLADGVEIWNGGWWSSEEKNPKSLRYWQQLAGGSHLIPATAGADFHGKEDWGEGAPSTYVYAGAQTAQAVLEGLRQGRVIVSSGPWLSLELSNGSQRAGIGDRLPCPAGRIRVAAGWRASLQGARLEVHGTQGVLHSEPAAGEGSLSVDLPVQPPSPVWLELYGADGALLALANPINLF